MKKIFKVILPTFYLICCFVISGCSCSNVSKIKYNVSIGQSEIENDLTSNIDVTVTTTKKFREPIDTPCYKKMEGGKMVKLDTAEEKNICSTIDCYKKVDGKYVVMDKEHDVTKCIMGKFNCYEKVEKTYYKLLENPSGISSCYTADGTYFERATYEKAEKVKLESKKIISSQDDKLSYDSEYIKVSENKNHSLIYEFVIKNNDSKTIYIEALAFDDITQGKIKQGSQDKIKITEPSQKEIIEDKYYYVIGAKQSVTLKIEVKYLLQKDFVAKRNDGLVLNIPLIVK